MFSICYKPPKTAQFDWFAISGYAALLGVSSQTRDIVFIAKCRALKCFRGMNTRKSNKMLSLKTQNEQHNVVFVFHGKISLCIKQQVNHGAGQANKNSTKIKCYLVYFWSVDV